MTSNGSRPIRCQMCGHWFADADAAWDHDCPRWDEELEARRPTPASFKTVAHELDKMPLSRWQRRLLSWGTRVALGPDATMYDAMARSPRTVDRVAQRIRARQAHQASRKAMDQALIQPLEARNQGGAGEARALWERPLEARKLTAYAGP